MKCRSYVGEDGKCSGLMGESMFIIPCAMMQAIMSKINQLCLAKLWTRLLLSRAKTCPLLKSGDRWRDMLENLTCNRVLNLVMNAFWKTWKTHCELATFLPSLMLLRSSISVFKPIDERKGRGVSAREGGRLMWKGKELGISHVNCYVVDVSNDEEVLVTSMTEIFLRNPATAPGSMIHCFTISQGVC